MSIITPTVGRVVLFRPGIGFAGIQMPDGDPLPALISRVWNDRLINIGGFDADGKPFSATSVPLIQDGEPAPTGFYAEWMPYQKGQAAKTEALEKQTAAEAGPLGAYKYREQDAHSVASSAANQVPYSGDPGNYARAVATVYKDTKAEILRPGVIGTRTT